MIARLASIALALAVAGSALASAASAARPQPVQDATPPVVPDRFDRIVGGPLTATAATTTRRYRTGDGYQIPVTVSAAYRSRPRVARTYVDFLESLPHGSELGRIKLSILTPTAVSRTCGGDETVLACYSPREERMWVPGNKSPRFGDVSTGYVLAHEYGHHIARNRANRPYPSIDYGPKHWASQQRVCLKAINGRVSPGDEGDGYFANPGEAFAETYAQLRYPDVRWRFADSLRPTPGTYAAARRDVLRPWRRNVVQRFSGGLSAATPTADHSFTLTLDGPLSIALDGPDGANYDLTLTSGGEVEDTSSAAGSDDRIRYAAACRDVARETVTVTVSRRTGSGPYSLKVSYAG